jgi:hypothetical protein
MYDIARGRETGNGWQISRKFTGSEDEIQKTTTENLTDQEGLA